MAPVEKILIIGGGIGGMCAALQMRKLGIAVDLVEVDPNWSVYGAGITISGPTLRALRSVGVVDQVIASAGTWSDIDICAADGSAFARLPIPKSQGAEDLPPAAAILRPVFARILSDATRASGVAVKLGATFERIEQDGLGVDVLFTDGTRSRYDLVIGADGINSKVRTAIFPDAPQPRFTGQGSWRAVLPRTVERSTIYMGANTKAGCNPVSTTEMYLFCLDHRKNFDFIPAQEWPRLMAEQLAEFGGIVGQVRKGLLDGSIGESLIVYRPLMGAMMEMPWHSGRVALLGDAVHATTPHLAMGAGIAVEGAVVLAEELQRATELDAALTAYAERRYERSKLVVTASMRMGEIEQTGGSKDEQTQVMRDALGKLAAPI